MDSRIEEKSSTQSGNLVFFFISFWVLFIACGQTYLNYSYALHDPWGVRIYTLKNGLKVILCPDTNTRDVAGMVAVRAGSAQDPDHATGLAHYLEHMLFKGTKFLGTVNYEKEKPLLDKIKFLFEEFRKENDPVKAKKIYKKIDSLSFIASKYAIPNEYDNLLQALGAKEYNAMTMPDATLYYTILPSVNLEKWLTIESERFLNPVFRLFHTELEVVYEEKNISMSDDNDRLWTALAKELFSPLPYSYKTTIGTVEHLKKPSLLEIENYFRKYYVASNMALILCGNFNADQTIPLIEKLFSSLPSSELPQEKWPELAPIQKPYKKVTLSSKEKEFIEFAWRTPSIKDKEFMHLEILKQILFDGTGGILHDYFVKSSYATEANDVYFSLVGGAYFSIGLVPGSLRYEQLHDSLLSFIQNLKPTALHIKSAINKIRKNFYYLDDSPFDKVMLLQKMFIHQINWQDYINRLRYIDTISPAGIKHVINKYFLNQPYIVIHKVRKDTSILPEITKPNITPISGVKNVHSIFYRKIQSMPSIKEKFYPYIPNKNFFESTHGRTICYFTSNTKKNISELEIIYTVFPDSLKNFIPKLFLNASSTHSTLEQIQDFLSLNSIDFNCYEDDVGIHLLLSYLNENKNQAMEILKQLIHSSKTDEKTLQRLIKEYEVNFYDVNTNNYFTKLKKHVKYKSGIIGATDVIPESLKKISLTDFNNLFSLLKTPNAILFAGNLKDTNEIKSIFVASGGPISFNLNKEIIKCDTLFVFHFDNPQTLMNSYKIIPLQKSINNIYPQILLFNEYYPNVLFQRIRERKALAYSTNGQIIWTYCRNSLYAVLFSFIGTQTDKTCDAFMELNTIQKKIPVSLQEFELTKKSLIQKYNSEKPKNLEMLSNLYFLKRIGYSLDNFNRITDEIQALSYKDAAGFYHEFISKSPYSMAILTSPNNKNIPCLPVKKNITLSNKELR
ncbi:MAG: insulinase family protein [Bacteroidia bacterium]|nr:insulinase family protein [Bacteroidia bacterium]